MAGHDATLKADEPLILDKGCEIVNRSLQSNSRGQVLPVWLFASIMSIIFGLFLVSYGNAVSYQWRAQTAADTVARAAVSIQANEFNQMLIALYATGVEEYRIRHLIESLRITAGGAGGCSQNGSESCAQVWHDLRTAWLKSLTRYDTNAKQLSQITSTMHYANYQNDAYNFVSQFNSRCASAGNSQSSAIYNCDHSIHPFTYTLTAFQQRTNLQNARADATNIVLPSYYGTGNSNANPDVFAPVEAEVTVCVTVPPAFSWFNVTPSHVIARAAATDAMIEEDWMEPGQDKNPFSGQVFQPSEIYGPSDTAGLNNWYAVNFGGTGHNVVAATGGQQNSYIGSAITQEQYLARVGWWGPVPILPFQNNGASSSNLQGTCS